MLQRVYPQRENGGGVRVRSVGLPLSFSVFFSLVLRLGLQGLFTGTFQCSATGIFPGKNVEPSTSLVGTDLRSAAYNFEIGQGSAGSAGSSAQFGDHSSPQAFLEAPSETAPVTLSLPSRVVQSNPDLANHEGNQAHPNEEKQDPLPLLSDLQREYDQIYNTCHQDGRFSLGFRTALENLCQAAKKATAECLSIMAEGGMKSPIVLNNKRQRVTLVAAPSALIVKCLQEIERWRLGRDNKQWRLERAGWRHGRQKWQWRSGPRRTIYGEWEVNPTSELARAESLVFQVVGLLNKLPIMNTTDKFRQINEAARRHIATIMVGKFDYMNLVGSSMRDLILHGRATRHLHPWLSQFSENEMQLLEWYTISEASQILIGTSPSTFQTQPLREVLGIFQALQPPGRSGVSLPEIFKVPGIKLPDPQDFQQRLHATSLLKLLIREAQGDSLGRDNGNREIIGRRMQASLLQFHMLNFLVTSYFPLIKFPKDEEPIPELEKANKYLKRYREMFETGKNIENFHDKLEDLPPRVQGSSYFHLIHDPSNRDLTFRSRRLISRSFKRFGLGSLSIEGFICLAAGLKNESPEVSTWLHKMTEALLDSGKNLPGIRARYRGTKNLAGNRHRYWNAIYDDEFSVIQHRLISSPKEREQLEDWLKGGMQGDAPLRPSFGAQGWAEPRNPSDLFRVSNRGEIGIVNSSPAAPYSGGWPPISSQWLLDEGTYQSNKRARWRDKAQEAHLRVPPLSNRKVDSFLLHAHRQLGLGLDNEGPRFGVKRSYQSAFPPSKRLRVMDPTERFGSHVPSEVQVGHWGTHKIWSELEVILDEEPEILFSQTIVLLDPNTGKRRKILSRRVTHSGWEDVPVGVPTTQQEELEIVHTFQNLRPIFQRLRRREFRTYEGPVWFGVPEEMEFDHAVSNSWEDAAKICRMIIDDWPFYMWAHPILFGQESPSR